MIVVDTQTLVWWVGGSNKLSRRAEQSLLRHDAVIPAICCWEIAMLALSDRIRLTKSVRETLDEILALPTMRLQALTPAIGIRAAGLSLGRSMDPADQLVAATALELNLPLVTSDGRLREFPGLETIW